MSITPKRGNDIGLTDTATLDPAESAGLLAGQVVKLVTGTTSPSIVDRCDVDTDIPHGILLYNAEAGKLCAVVTEGQVPGLSGAAFAQRVYLTVNGSGKLITAVTGDRIMAKSNEAATDADQLRNVTFIGDGGLVP